MQKNSLTGIMSVVKTVKQMVSTQPEAGSTAPDDSSGTFNKIWQVGSGFMTSGSNMTKIGPAKVTPVETIQPKESTPLIEPPKAKTEQDKLSACRICIKSIKPEDFSRTCYECQRKVCEDCASYSTQTDSNDPTWRCSVCRRKLAPREPALTTNGSLEVPMEGLARRHSDVRLSSQGTAPGAGTLGAGLVPPRSPDLRRHSDVSPASLKDLEKFRKFAGEQQRRGSNVATDDWDNKHRSKSRNDSPDRHPERGPIDRARGSSPQRSRKPSAVPDQDSGDIDEEEDRRHREMRAAQMGGGSIRRPSRVTRQHSYDDEIKTATAAAVAAAPGHSSHPAAEVAALGLPVRLARRKSDIAIYSTGGPPGLAAIVPSQHRASVSAQGTRESDVAPVSTSRRPSMRVSAAPLLADETSAPDVNQIIPPEDLKLKRRGSILPKIPTTVRPSVVPGPITRVPVDDRELPRQGSIADGEAIKIVIHDVDCDMLPKTKRKVILRKDVVVEKGYRTKSFGMRVVGGKVGSDNRFYAVVVWTVSGGPAEKAGLQKGDKVLEWGGVSLIDRNFEEVAHIIDRSGDVAELVVEHANDMSGDSMDEPVGMTPAEREKTPSNLGLGQLESESNKAPSSPTRRKLPKTPEQLAKERQVTGRVQIQVWYEADRKELVVSVLAADDLCSREDTGYGSQPEAFAKLDLISPSGDVTSLKTDVAEPTHNPIWNATLNFTNVAGEQLIDRLIEVTLWDYCPDRDSVFLGGCSIEMASAFEADRAVWYRLEDPRGLRSGRSPHCSPRGSLSIELAQRLLRRADLRERSYSEDTQSDSGSPEPYFLHPDAAYLSGSRRGSSQSEQLEIEPYELSKDYSRSLPGSRRSSFQSQAGATDSKRGSMGEADVSMVHYNRERRRSSFARPKRDQEEILETLRSLKAQQHGKGELSRTMSLSGEKRRPNRQGERRESSVLEMKRHDYDRNSDSDDAEKWSQSMMAEDGLELKLGPGQLAPKGYKPPKDQNGKVQLTIYLSKGNLEVEVISAKDICSLETEEPDTYIKMYLRGEDRWLHKRKTRVVRHSRNPQFRQTLKYPSCDALGRNLLVMLWEKKQGFESNQGLGGAEIQLDALALTRLTIGWYHLFPIHTLGTQNADSP
ncbi:regulating synaptic membrane exocytosis protein 1 isoform X2 [Phymastichus coffea]|uniref:regulating synaptic membrane exocytosis protein 1 isoform X2 n=1 Tax=Phymastichus coffea TaxID=108790 RepID=UPI00273B626C|nr:regulating synaptic membrane exocytosis protein 1 isoform X2 [Phymastichus coffea]